MEDKSKVTVIVPIYNAESYLSKCMDGILGQTYANLQIILVDDGSTDASGRICDDYAEKDKRIKVFHTENKGLVSARKLGISHASGDYIGFVDADDYIEPGMYEYLHRHITESHADFIHTGYIEENSGKSKTIYEFENGICDLESMEERTDFLSRYVLCAKKNREISPSIWSKLFRKDLIEKSYFPLPDGRQYGEDLLCLILSILQSKRIVLKKKAFYHYVTSHTSLSRLNDMDYFIQETELNHHVIKVIQNYDRPCYEKLKGDICCFLENRFLVITNRIHNGTVCLAHYYFTDIESLRGKKIALYGAGIVGQNYYSQFCQYRDIEIAAWFDSNWENCRFDYADVLDGTGKVAGHEFDKIIIAVLDESVAVRIKEMLKENGLAEEKIVWFEPGNILDLKTKSAKEAPWG